MSRTFINQSTQIGNSEAYNDSLTPGSGLQNQETLEGDLNALRTMLKQVVNPQGNWYDQPASSLEQLNTSVSGQGTDIAALQADVATVEGDIATINTTIAAQAAEIDAVELNVATLQTQVATAEGNISTLSTSLAATDVNVATLQGEMQSAQANISLLTTNLATTDSNVSTLQGEVLTAQGDITTLQSGLSSAQGNIADLQADLGTAEGSIATLQLDVSNLTTQQNNQGISIAGLMTDLAETDAAVSGLDARLTTAEGEIDTLQVGLSTAEGSITSLSGRMTTAEGEIDTLQSDMTAAQGSISTLQSDVAGKVSKSGDTMSGALTIDVGVGVNALALTAVGPAFTIADALDGQFFEINTSLQQMTFSDPLGSGNVAVVDPAEVVVSTNDGQGTNLARTNITSGVIELVQNGAPAVPSSPEQVATKKYVDGIAQGLNFKAPVKARLDLASGASIPSGPAQVDDVSAVAGDRIFVVADDAALSGIYEVQGQAQWTRTADYAEGIQADGTFVFVQQGTAYANTSWVEVDTAIVGSDALSFVQFDAPTNYYAGAGLELSQATFSIAADGVSTSMVADAAITNSKLAGSIELSKLAESVYTQAQVDSALALKLDLAGGTMSGAIAMGDNLITGLADPQADQDAATKGYVDEAIAAIPAVSGVRVSKTFAEVLQAVTEGSMLVGGQNGNLSAELPSMPSDATEFAANYDVFLNGQLLRPGTGNDVTRDASVATALVLEFDAAAGDVICVVKYGVPA